VFYCALDGLHVNVNGMKERLRVTRRNAAVSAVTGSVSALAISTNAVVLSSFANPILTYITAALAIVQVIIVSTNVGLHIISSNDLEKLRLEVEKLEEARKIGLAIQESVNKTSREVMTLAQGRNIKFVINKYN